MQDAIEGFLLSILTDSELFECLPELRVRLLALRCEAVQFVLHLRLVKCLIVTIDTTG